MPFFIRRKPPKRPVKQEKNSGGSGAVKKSKVDEEVTSESENEAEIPEIESEEETVQEKRLRLTKKYLDEIAIEEKKRLEKSEITREEISLRLKEDVLDQVGRLKKAVAANYLGFGNVLVLRNKDHRLSITSAVISSNSEFIYSGSKDNIIIKWSRIESRKVKSIKVTTDVKKVGHQGNILCLCLSSDDKYLVSGSSDSLVRIWDPTDLKLIHTFRGHKKAITGVVFRKSSHQLFTSSYDKSIKVWSLDEMSYIETLFGHQEAVLSVDALLKERAISCGGRDNSVRIWKIVEESQLLYLSHQSSVEAVKFLSDEHFITGSDDGAISLWGVLKKKPLFTQNCAHGKDQDGNPNWIVSLAALPNTDLFASGSCDGTIRLWHCNESFRGFKLQLEIPLEGFINSLCFNRDGSHLLATTAKEHRLGRWWNIKEVKNSIQFIQLSIKS